MGKTQFLNLRETLKRILRELHSTSVCSVAGGKKSGRGGATKRLKKGLRD